MPESRLILQEVLDDLGGAVMTDDWEGFCARIMLPFEMETEGASFTVTTTKDLREGYDAFRDMILLRQVTDYIRLVEDAAFEDPDTIRGHYASHILSKGVRVVPPYRALMVLRRRGNQWFVTRIVNNWQNDSWPILTPRPAEEPGREGGAT